jgi:ribonuclease HII
VCELYAFDEQILYWVLTAESAKDAEVSCEEKISFDNLRGEDPEEVFLLPEASTAKNAKSAGDPFSRTELKGLHGDNTEHFKTPDLVSGAQNQDSLCALSDLCGKVRFAGFDEAGRGALAGPVAVGCVHFPVLRSGSIPHSVAGQHTDRSITQSFNHSILHSLAGVDDSKRLSPARREEMYRRITEVASWGVGWASAQEIDRLGIVPAVSLAARRAYSMMGERVDLLLCDRGLSLLSDPRLEELNDSITQSLNPSIPQSLELSFTKGDSRSLHIAAASILAKVARDRLMLDLHQRFPAYGFATNKGYGTPTHLAALRKNGRSAIHRRSFKVKE